jgi:Zn-dependent peptidase ImmA (M78 family)/DNA-binding XRE family transcriptional regulator
MLRLARESRGLTQSELADRIPTLEQGNLSKMEKGILKITDETLTKIAAELDYPLAFFFKSEPMVPACSFYYRKRQAFPKKELSFLEARMDVIRLSVDELLTSVDIPNYSLPEIQSDSKITPEAIARHVRSLLNIPRGPIEKPIEILENSGIMVYFLEVEYEKFDGITLFTNSGCPIIFINEKMPNDRKRFTLGHELGHLIMHIPFKDIEDPYLAEKEADRFSAEYNMPELDIRNDLLRLKFNDLDDLKAYWRMSKAAIIHRAKDLKLITDKTYKYMVIELSRRGERKSEVGRVSLDSPKLIKSIISVHKTDLGYSNDDMAKILSLSPGDFDRYFETKPRVLKIA